MKKFFVLGCLIFAIGAFGAEPNSTDTVESLTSSGAAKVDILASGYAKIESGVLDAQQSFEIASSAMEFNKAKDRRAGIVISRNIVGDSIGKYAELIRDGWSAQGSSPLPNVLIVIAVVDRKVQVLTDKSIASEMPDAEVESLLNRVMIPALTQGNYVTAVSQMLGGITAYLDAKQAKLAEQKLAAVKAAEEAAAAEVARKRAEQVAVERAAEEQFREKVTWAAILAVGLIGFVGLYFLTKRLKRVWISSGGNSRQVRLIPPAVCVTALVAFPILYKVGFEVYKNSLVGSVWGQIGRVIYPRDPIPTWLSASWLGGGSGKALEPPFRLSCGKVLPSTWEDGNVYDFDENGQLSLASTQMQNKGTVMMVGSWSRNSEGYVLTFKGLLKDSGQIVAGDPQTLRVEKFLDSGSVSGSGRTVDMVGRSATHRCHLGGVETQSASSSGGQYRQNVARVDPSVALVARVRAKGGNCETIANHLESYRQRATQSGDWSGFQETLGRGAQFGCTP